MSPPLLSFVQSLPSFPYCVQQRKILKERKENERIMKEEKQVKDWTKIKKVNE